MVDLRKETESQENMEAWMAEVLDMPSALYQTGFVPRLEAHYMDCSLEDGWVEVVFDVLEWEINPEGGLHGGIIAAQFDMTFALLSHYYAKQNMVTTVQLAINYLKPILPADRVHYRIKTNFRGRRLISMTGEAHLERAYILAATGTATFMILDKMFDRTI